MTVAASANNVAIRRFRVKPLASARPETETETFGSRRALDRFDYSNMIEIWNRRD
jgi:hypothetical protein